MASSSKLSRLFLCWLIFAFVCECGANARSPYVRKGTWHESVAAAAMQIAGEVPADPFAPFESETLRGGQAPVHVSVKLEGARELYLFVTGCPDYRWAVGDWADVKLVRADGSAEYVSSSNRFEIIRGRCERDITLRSGLYQPLRLAGREFKRGLNVQADSLIRIPVEPGFERFEAWIGVDDWAGTNGTVRFSVVGPAAAARKRLFHEASRDFTNGKARQEMAWEIEDRIFESEFKPGDWAALAMRYAKASGRVQELKIQAEAAAARANDYEGLAKVRQLYLRSRELALALERSHTFNFEGLRAAIEDLEKAGNYSPTYRARFDALLKEWAAVAVRSSWSQLEAMEATASVLAKMEDFRDEALLANPLMNFERLLLIKRKPVGDARRVDWEGYGYGEFLGVPRQSSWNYGTMPNPDRWTNEVAALSPARPGGRLTTVYKPEQPGLVADIDLHWNGEKLLFSKPDTNRNFQVCEIRADGSEFRQLTSSAHPDIHNYDACYLPGGEVLFLSTAPMQGVPCNASVIVGMMYKMGSNGERIRQLTFEQDHDYTPAVLNNGRVLYLRWDYTDTPHIWNRLLMSMNPDGTGQMEYYGGNSYWPNAIFFARPIPNHLTKIAGIVTGHHEGRVGELFVFDPAKGRHETSGVVQRIPRAGPPVEAKLEDKLTEHSWPKFLHPWPLSEKHFLVACKPEPMALWGIYLVDVFDNMVLLKEEEGFALLEPVPLSQRPQPPVIQNRTLPSTRDALAYIEDIYEGPGLRGVPRGTIKNLRLFTYHFGYQRLAGIDHRVGADGPWEAKRVLGTVPVEEDGSAFFTIPAKTPISIQPLDSEGKAVALMRSWLTAMPGESLSCTGCHERQSTAPPSAVHRIALARGASKIKPRPGPQRGFSFIRDVQPVLDKYCVGCHNGENTSGEAVDFRREQDGYVVYRNGELDGRFIRGARKEELLGKYGAVFEPSYVALRKFVRVGGLESDLHVLPPMEFHADTSELIRLLRKGHHGVKLDADAWERLATWIDLNAPCHGRWGDTTKIPGNQCQRRIELQTLFGGLPENGETMPEDDSDYEIPEPIVPECKNEPIASPELEGWPLTSEQAKASQNSAGAAERFIELGNGARIRLVRIPAGRFVMGSGSGPDDERPPHVVEIERPFWMADCEISNEQFRQFDSRHDSRFEHRTSWIFSEEYLGWPLNKPRQPVVRVSWNEAMEFCHWLSAKTGERVTLPTEQQWEYACRAGTASDLHFGDAAHDYSRLANLGDFSLRRLADEGWRPKSPDLVPRDEKVNDTFLVTAEVGAFEPNAWGLRDMHGNACEWTRSVYQPYSSGHSDAGQGKRVARGGSWRDRAKYCRSAYRFAYEPYQKVYNVGFRIIVE